MTEPISERVHAALAEHSIVVNEIELRTFPDEITAIIRVDPTQFIAAVELANDLEPALGDASGTPVFLVVRKSEQHPAATAASRISGVNDDRVSELVRLISAKSRVSGAEPNLVYVPDARANLSSVTAGRHQIIFGRRGAGKSALLMEARRQVSLDGDLFSWTNVQSLRHESPQRIFLYVVQDVLESLISGRRAVPARSSLAVSLSEEHEAIRKLLVEDETTLESAQRVVPRVQRAISRFTDVEGTRLVAFIDDFYYIPRDSQPQILDMLHGVTRDSRLWLKVASIRHLTNWWQASPPLGLQSGQDADILDLDVTLQDPKRASEFLQEILAAYAREVGITSLSRIFNSSALDRLVLAAGAVPRDFMVLAVSAIGRARRREKAKLTGVQDVNQAAGDAAASKLQELEEDMASNSGVAERTLATLKRVRDFCLDERSFTYFLVSYRDKESHTSEYGLLADLMDVRLIHLIDSGVSDAHEAGVRFEAYMLDLSQFSGSRLKQKITVLDFEDGHFVSRQTRTSEPARRGTSSLQLISILRRGPVLELGSLGAQVVVPGVTLSYQNTT